MKVKAHPPMKVVVAAMCLLALGGCGRVAYLEDDGGPEDHPFLDGDGDDGDAAGAETSPPVVDALPDAGVEAPQDSGADLGADAPADVLTPPPDARAEAAPETRPACASPIADDWNYVLTRSSEPWRLAFGDPSIDTPNNSLRLTYDDIAEREAINGSYVLSFDLAIEGNLTFYAAASATTAFLPSITREGTALILSTTYYSAHVLQAGGGFTDLRVKVPPGNTVHVTLYMKKTAEQLAMKVTYAGTTYASGFMPTDINREGLGFVGNNDGFTGVITVGVLSGCASLTDAEVEAAAAE